MLYHLSPMIISYFLPVKHHYPGKKLVPRPSRISTWDAPALVIIAATRSTSGEL